MTEQQTARGGLDGGAPDPSVMSALGLDAKGARKRVGMWLLLPLVLGAAGYGVYYYLEARAASEQVTYRVEPVQRSDLEVVVTATGTLRGLGTVEVGAEVSGKIRRVEVDWNARVTKGQLLCELDPEQLEAAVAESKARVREADASVRQADATRKDATRIAERAQAQATRGLLAQAELESAQTSRERAEASVQSARAAATLARAALDSAQSRLEKTKIFSPIDGVVLARMVEPGQTVTAGFQTPVLFKLAEDLRKMSLHVLVDEADMGRVKEGQAATFAVDAYPSKRFQSAVLELRNEPRTEQNVVSYEAVLHADNAELLLRPGMTATASIIAGRHTKVLTVPSAALRFAPRTQSRSAFGPRPPQQPKLAASGKNRIYVLQDGAPSPIDVVTGVSDGTRTEIVSGPLQEGSQVIVDSVEPAT